MALNEADYTSVIVWTVDRQRRCEAIVGDVALLTQEMR